AGASITNLDCKPYKFGDDGIVASVNIEISELLTQSLKREITFLIKGELLSFRSCIFDFDGVIVDTEKYHIVSWNNSCQFLNVNISEDEYLPLKSTGSEHIIDFIAVKVKRSLSPKEREIISLQKKSYFSRCIKNITERDMIGGVSEF